MFKRLKHMLIKEFLQLFRDPRMRMVVFGVPLIQMLVLSFALTNDVTEIRTAVLDMDRSVTSRELISEFVSSGYFEIVEEPGSDREMADVLDNSRARLVLHIPAGFEEDVLAGRTGNVQIIADATDSNTTAIVMGYASQVVGDYASRKLRDNISAVMGSGAAIGQVEFETRAWFNPNLESKYFYVPGIIAIMLILICMLLTSVAIVREKEIGTIEQVMVTPITSMEFILGKTMPYAIIGYVTMTIMLGLAMVIFGIVVKGSWLLLYVLTGFYILSNLGIALLISTSASTQQQALLTSFLIMMPAMLLGGFLFPVHNMPPAVQYLTYLDPIRWYIDMLRGVVMKGVGLGGVWQAAVGQLVLAVSFMSLAVVRFRKKVT